jgi:hypothetical protein
VNTHDLMIQFGKHKGKRWTRVPVSYLRWIINESTFQGREVLEIAKAELERRGSVLPEIEISGHAIDRASLRLRRIWHEDRKCDEGLYSWLHRVALEARDSCVKDEQGRFNHKGIRFVFEDGEEFPSLKTVMKVR